MAKKWQIEASIPVLLTMDRRASCKLTVSLQVPAHSVRKCKGGERKLAHRSCLTFSMCTCSFIQQAFTDASYMPGTVVGAENSPGGNSLVEDGPRVTGCMHRV